MGNARHARVMDKAMARLERERIAYVLGFEGEQLDVRVDERHRLRALRLLDDLGVRVSVTSPR